MRRFVFVAALAAGCGGGAASMALVDLFGQEGTVVSASLASGTPRARVSRNARIVPPGPPAVGFGWHVPTVPSKYEVNDAKAGNQPNGMASSVQH